MTHHEAQQAATARWMGYPDAAAMNADHDRLHRSLCAWLGIPSHSLAQAAGEPHDEKLAWIEEDAAMYVQRLLAHAGVGMPSTAEATS